MAYQNLVRRLKFLRDSYRRHGAEHIIEVFRQGRIRSRYAANPPSPIATTDLMQRFEWFRSEESFMEDFYRSVASHLPLNRASRKEFFTGLLLSLQSYDDILTDAEIIADGHFPALGVCINEPEAGYDWHRDYSSGKTWPPVPFNRITYMEGDGSDVKYPWELNRMYWIAWLGKAYWISGNPAWVRDFVRLIDDWRERNPFNIGVNWAMPMEVALRGFWLMMGFGMFYGARGIDNTWWIEYLAMAWNHAVYLERNLEYFFNLTNHYLSNCFGLVALGSLFAGTPDGKRWLSEGRSRMIRELQHQVLPDGVHYERSIGYHRLVLEMYLTADVILRCSGVPFPQSSRDHIQRMAEFMCDYIPPTGDAPQFGDSDDGVLLRLRHNQALYDHRDTLALAASVFQRSDFYAVAGEYSQAALLITGSEGFEVLRQSGTAQRPSRLYPDGGFAILRNSQFFVVADIGPIGLHGNNDTLSFTLNGPNGPFIIDPGTYCYTRDREIRNELRSTSAHNAPAVDNVEIAEFDGLWRVKSDPTAPRIAHWESGESGRVVLDAEHQAYTRLASGGVTVGRRWELEGDKLRITDRLDGTGTHDISTRFTLAEGCTIEIVDQQRLIITQPSGDQLEVISTDPLTSAAGWYSPSYGVAATTAYILQKSRCTAPKRIEYICRLISSR
jgi:uncharacterized heparinase superfamily protein